MNFALVPLRPTPISVTCTDCLISWSASVFVAPESAGYLDDKVLDARTDGDGTPVFAVSRR